MVKEKEKFRSERAKGEAEGGGDVAAAGRREEAAVEWSLCYIRERERRGATDFGDS